MRNRNSSSSVLIIGFVVLIVLLIGWTMNIIKLVNLDFQSPYKAEVVRLIGIPAWPVGSIIGYMDIEDGIK